jgi:hypothetical protein
MIILGILWIFGGISGFFTDFERPVLFGGVLHTGIQALIFHLVPIIGGMYIGYGLLKPLRHIWYVYITGACISIIGLSFNVIHEAKIWEMYLLLQSEPEAIPRLVRFTIETHYLFIAIYALTSLYVYLQKNYFWGV